MHYRDPETGKDYVFLTNLPDLPALVVADLYRQRWQIETFFPLDQVEPENQSLLRDLGERRPHSNLDCHDRLSAPPVAEAKKLGELVYPGTDPYSAKSAHGTLFNAGGVLRTIISIDQGRGRPPCQTSHHSGVS